MKEYEVGEVVNVVFPQNNPNLMQIVPDFLVIGGDNGGSSSSRGLSNNSEIEPYTSAPRMDGVASAGSSTKFARGDHRHPTDTTRQEALTQAQLDAVNSGITAEKVAQIGQSQNMSLYRTASQQDAIDAQIQSEISDKVSCTDETVGSFGYIKLSDLPIYDGSVI